MCRVPFEMNEQTNERKTNKISEKTALMRAFNVTWNGTRILAIALKMTVSCWPIQAG